MTAALTRRLYAVAWLVLSAVALVYLYSLFQPLHGPLTASWSASPFGSSPFAGNSGEEQDTGSTDPSLSRALARMSGEIETLKASLESARQENAALKAHVETLESAYGLSTTSALPPESETPPREAPRPGRTASSEPERKIEISMLPMPQDGFEDTFPQAPLPIANLQEPRRTQFAVELATSLEDKAVEQRWAALSERHRKLLAALQPRKIADRGSGTYKLIAGPFDNAADAALLCARLGASQTKCEGTVFAGAPVGDVAAR